VELFSSLIAISALLVSKFVNDQHADDKTVDALEQRLDNPEPHQEETKH
jgi:hypothetical protein